MSSMSKQAEILVDRIGFWCGLGFLVFIVAGLIPFAGFVPPPAPSLGHSELVSLFEGKLNSMRIAMICIMLAGGMYAISYALVARYVSFVEGRWGLLAMSMLVFGVMNGLAFMVPPIFWLTALFRIDVAPEIVAVLNTMGWIMFLGMAAPTIFIMLISSLVAFLDQSKIPLFPRWFGYLNIWGAMIFLPGQLIFFFYDGIFAWNGLVGFWLVAADFFLQYLFTMYFVYVAINRKAQTI